MKDAIITTEPKDADVLCGRGAAVTKHIGNQTYIKLVKFNKVLYATSSILEKGQISRSIVIAIQEIGGRFLVEQKRINQGQRFWVDIGDKKAIEKTSQALRENQPKVRKQLQESILRNKKKYILPFTTNKHHLLTTMSAGVENISAKVDTVTSSNNNKWANNNNDDMNYHNDDDNDDVLSMLKHEAIGYNANDDEMEKYVRELKILGLHSTKMIIQFCKDDDVNEWTWMKKFHRRAFKAWVEIKRK
jgi:hypothetical protein